MVFQLIIFAFITFCILSRIRKKKNYPNGPWRLPIIGNLHQLGEFPHINLLKMSKKFGPIFSIKFGSYETLVLSDHKLIKEATSHPAMAGRFEWMPFLARSGGVRRGIAVTEGREHEEQRRFSIKALRDLGIGKSSAEYLIREELQEFVKRLALKNGEPVDIINLFGGAMLSSLMVLLCGQRIDQDNPLYLENIRNLEMMTPYKYSIEAATTVLPWIISISKKFSGFNRMLERIKNIEKFVQSFIDSHIENPIEGPPTDFIYAYLEEMKKSKDKSSSFYGKVGMENLTFSMFDLFGGGGETTKIVMAFICVFCVTFPEKQERIRREIKRLKLNEPPSLSHKPMLPYTEAFINEVLRFRPLMPLSILRRTTEDIKFHGFEIPAGTNILSNTYAAHYDKNVWGDENYKYFRPERFLDPNGCFQKHESFFPFGSGRRACPGEQFARDNIFLFTTFLINNFKIQPDSRNPDQPHLRVVNTLFTIHPLYSKVSFIKL